MKYGGVPQKSPCIAVRATVSLGLYDGYVNLPTSAPHSMKILDFHAMRSGIKTYKECQACNPGLRPGLSYGNPIGVLIERPCQIGVWQPSTQCGSSEALVTGHWSLVTRHFLFTDHCSLFTDMSSCFSLTVSAVSAIVP